MGRESARTAAGGARRGGPGPTHPNNPNEPPDRPPPPADVSLLGWAESPANTQPPQNGGKGWAYRPCFAAITTNTP